MSLVEDLGVPWYDASKLTTYNLCPQKYKWRYVDHLVGLGLDTPLVFGTAFHKAMETLYRGRPMAEVNAAFLDAFPVELEAKDRTRNNGLLLIAGYCNKWRKEEFELLTEPEQAFHFEIDGVAYVGRIDLITITEGTVRPLDHKTLTQYGKSFELGFKLDIAQTGYIVGTRKLTSEPVREAIISASRITSKVSEESFVRKYTSRFPWEIDNWYKEVRGTIKRIQDSTSRSDWPRHAPEACFSFNSVCPYWSLCTSQDPQPLVDSAFRVEIWEPV